MKIKRKFLQRGMSLSRGILQSIKSGGVRASHLLIGTAALFLIVTSGSGAILFWDAGNTNNGPVIDPGSGSWNIDTTTNLNWNNGSSNVSWTQGGTTAPTTGASFGGPDAPDGTYQIALDGSQIAFTNLAISANGYVFNGPASLYQGTSGILSVDDGKSVTFSNNFAANNSAIGWRLGAGGAPANMLVTGNIGGSQIQFFSTNGSTFWLAGNSSPSVVTINANVSQTNGSFTTTGFSIGRPNFALNLQPLAGNATFPGVFTLDGPTTTMTVGTALQIARGGGSGKVIVQNGATMNVTGANNVQVMSDSSGGHGFFYVNGGSLTMGMPAARAKLRWTFRALRGVDRDFCAIRRWHY